MDTNLIEKKLSEKRKLLKRISEIDLFLEGVIIGRTLEHEEKEKEKEREKDKDIEKKDDIKIEKQEIDSTIKSNNNVKKVVVKLKKNQSPLSDMVERKQKEEEEEEKKEEEEEEEGNKTEDDDIGEDNDELEKIPVDYLPKLKMSVREELNTSSFMDWKNEIDDSTFEIMWNYIINPNMIIPMDKIEVVAEICKNHGMYQVKDRLLNEFKKHEEVIKYNKSKKERDLIPNNNFMFRVESARKRENWSAVELAKKLGTSGATYSQAKTGKIKPKDSWLSLCKKIFKNIEHEYPGYFENAWKREFKLPIIEV